MPPGEVLVQHVAEVHVLEIKPRASLDTQHGSLLIPPGLTEVEVTDAREMI